MKLGLPDKGRVIKGLVVCYNRDIEPLDLQHGLALGCYQPSPEVLIVYLRGKADRSLLKPSVTSALPPYLHLHSFTFTSLILNET